jgi:hypothetical protein
MLCHGWCAAVLLRVVPVKQIFDEALGHLRLLEGVACALIAPADGRGGGGGREQVAVLVA